MTALADGRYQRTVVVATRLQERLVAVVTTVTLLLVGLIGRGHAADVAHVEDEHGRLVHAQQDEALAAHDRTTRTTHLHEHAPAHADAGACSLLATVHQAAIASVTASFTSRAVAHVVAPLRAHASIYSLGGYRLAPKTSPPIAG